MFSKQDTDIIGFMAALPTEPSVILVDNEPYCGISLYFFVLHYKVFHIHNEESHKNESMYVHVTLYQVYLWDELFWSVSNLCHRGLLVLTAVLTNSEETS